MNARRSLRLAFATLFGLAWCWSALRVAAEPGQAGPVEEGITAGGWTLSILPAHVSLWRGRRLAPARTYPAAARAFSGVQGAEGTHGADMAAPVSFPAGLSVPGAEEGDGTVTVPEFLPAMPPPRSPAFGGMRPVVRPRVPAGATAVSALSALGCRPGQRPVEGDGPLWQDGHQ